MKLNKSSPKGNVSAASVRRVCRIYKAYLDMARTLTSMEAECDRDHYVAVVSKRISALSELSLHVLVHRRPPADYYQTMIHVWHCVLDWRDHMLSTPNPRAEHLYTRIYYVDDLLRYALYSFNIKVNR